MRKAIKHKTVFNSQELNLRLIELQSSARSVEAGHQIVTCPTCQKQRDYLINYVQELVVSEQGRITISIHNLYDNFIRGSDITTMQWQYIYDRLYEIVNSRSKKGKERNEKNNTSGI